MIARILHFRDRENILRAARTIGDLQFNGNRISIYPDFSAATQKQRASFLHVKKRLRDLHMAYSMMYPAKLRVVGRAKFFSSTLLRMLHAGWMLGGALVLKMDTE